MRSLGCLETMEGTEKVATVIEDSRCVRGHDAQASARTIPKLKLPSMNMLHIFSSVHSESCATLHDLAPCPTECPM